MEDCTGEGLQCSDCAAAVAVQSIDSRAASHVKAMPETMPAGCRVLRVICTRGLTLRKIQLKSIYGIMNYEDTTIEIFVHMCILGVLGYMTAGILSDRLALLRMSSFSVASIAVHRTSLSDGVMRNI